MDRVQICLPIDEPAGVPPTPSSVVSFVYSQPEVPRIHYAFDHVSRKKFPGLAKF